MRIGNIIIKRAFPKGSTVIAKEYFKNKPISVIEVGVYKGENAVSMLKELNIEKLILIDKYKAYDQKDQIEERNFGKTQEELDKALETMVSKLAKVECTTFIKKDSLEALEEIDEMVDFVYIDANHDYLPVLREIRGYWKKVKEGGIMAGDNMNYPSVAKAVTHFSEQKKVKVMSRENDWIIKKTGELK